MPDGRFGDTLREEIGPWLAGGEEHVLLSGMIGSRQGWKEAPYLPCPAGPAELAGALVDIGFDWARVKLVPGVSGTDDSGRGRGDARRGNPGAGRAAVDARGRHRLPARHPLQVGEGGRRPDHQLHHAHDRGNIRRPARSYHSGPHDARRPADGVPFDAGVARSADPGGLLHHLFGVRALALADRLKESDAPAYLSGILIGHEVRAALARAPAAPWCR